MKIQHIKISVAFAYYVYLLTITQPPRGEPQCLPSSFAIRLTPGNSLPHLEGYGSLAEMLFSMEMAQVLFNIFMFVPLGYLMMSTLINSKHPYLYTAGLTVLGTFSIELLQLTGLLGIYECQYRVFDIDDLIWNTMGGLIGIVLYQLMFNNRKVKQDGNHQG